MKVTAYLSHTIRGEKSTEATHEDMKRNCDKAMEMAVRIRQEYGNMLDLYVPAENDTFVQIAFDAGIITEDQILDVDCRIIDQKDMVIVLVEDGWIGGGIGVEVKHAEDNHVPVFFVEIEPNMELVWKNLSTLIHRIDAEKQHGYETSA